MNHKLWHEVMREIRSEGLSLCRHALNRTGIIIRFVLPLP